MKWTKQKPCELGQYWFRAERGPFSNPVVFLIRRIEGELMGVSYYGDFLMQDFPIGYWSDHPIPLPETEEPSE